MESDWTGGVRMDGLGSFFIGLYGLVRSSWITTVLQVIELQALMSSPFVVFLRGWKTTGLEEACSVCYIAGREYLLPG